VRRRRTESPFAADRGMSTECELRIRTPTCQCIDELHYAAMCAEDLKLGRHGTTHCQRHGHDSLRRLFAEMVEYQMIFGM